MDWLKTTPPVFKDIHTLVDNSQVTLFTDREDVFPAYQPRHTLKGVRQPLPVTLIATLRNEQGSAEAWLRAVFAQSRLPDEIILVDGGSTDGTLAVIERLSAESPVPLRLIKLPGSNIAAGRNRAIAAATTPVIAVSDFGCTPRPDWLENLVLPFEMEPRFEVVSGFYDVVDRSGAPLLRRAWRLEKVQPQAFLPSSRSVAFTRAAWQQVGGYPEWLSLTGEDTLFDFELKRLCRNWAFVPGARVVWHGPETLMGYWHKVKQWSAGDGEAGMNGAAYWHSAKRSLVLAGVLVLWLGMLLAALLGGGWLPLLLAAGLALVVTLYLGRWLQQNHHPLSALPADLLTDFARLDGYFTGVRRRKS